MNKTDWQEVVWARVKIVTIPGKKEPPSVTICWVLSPTESALQQYCKVCSLLPVSVSLNGDGWIFGMLHKHWPLPYLEDSEPHTRPPSATPTNFMTLNPLSYWIVLLVVVVLVVFSLCLLYLSQSKICYKQQFLSTAALIPKSKWVSGVRLEALATSSHLPSCL